MSNVNNETPRRMSNVKSPTSNLKRILKRWKFQKQRPGARSRAGELQTSVGQLVLMRLRRGQPRSGKNVGRWTLDVGP